MQEAEAILEDIKPTPVKIIGFGVVRTMFLVINIGKLVAWVGASTSFIYLFFSGAY